MNKTYSWQGGTSTAFGVATNWFDVTDGITAASPPGMGDAVQLTGFGTIDGMASGLTTLTVVDTSGAGYAVGATLGVSAVEVDGSLALTNGATLNADTLGVDAGTLVLQGGSVLQAAGQALAISVSGTGAASSVLQVASGGFVDVGLGTVDVGLGAGQSGTLLITGGTLSAAAASGTSGALLAIGTQGATGTVAIGSGGAIVQCAVDVGVSGQGLLTLGAGAQLTALNFDGPALALGLTAAGSAVAGQGTLISLGATISAYGGDTLIGDTGQGDLVAGGGTFSAGGVTLGLASGASGTLSIGANETWTAGSVVIGDAGNGTIQMTAFAPGSGSGTIGSLSIGTAGGSGTLAISHETLHVQGLATVGAGGGMNAITIGAGGVWNGVGQSLFLEPIAVGGGSTLSVAGAGAVFDAGSLFGFAGTQIRFGAGAHATLGDNPATDAFGTAGGTITIADAVLTVGCAMGVRADGTMTISGTSSLSGSDGLLVFDSGTVAIDGGVVNAASASGTAVQVSDAGTLAVSGGTLNTAGEFLIGYDPDGNTVPAGTFTAMAGAVITSRSATGAAVVIGGSGLPDVADLTGARWTVSGDMSLTMGSDVSLSAGAALDVNGLLHMGERQTPGNTNLLSVADSSLMASTLVVGLGTLSVGNGSTLVAGSAAGGMVFAAGVIGGGYDNSADVVIDASHALVEGQGEVGGTLTVSDGGTLSVTDGGSASAGPALTIDGGTLLVTGAHTALRMGGALLETSQTAVTDSVTISAGAQVSIAQPMPGAFVGLAVSGSAGTTAAVTIDGVGTALSVAGLVRIGFGDASSTLRVSNGAAMNVISAGMAIASDDGQTSLATVTGGAHLSVAGAIAIAPQDRGELAISSGGTVAAGSVAVGGPSAMHGSLSLAGSGDVLTTQLLTVGTTGTVTLGAGSHLLAGGLLVGSTGQGVATPGAATLDIAGGTLSVFGGGSVHGGVVLSQGGTLAVSNGLTLAAGSTVIGQGVLGAGNIVDLGRIGCNGGTMTCLGPVNGSGLLSVAGGDVVLAHGEASTVGLVFGANGTFTAAGVGLISGTITGWSTGDAFDFTRVQIASDSFSGHVLTLMDSAGHVLGRETFAGSFTSSNFSLSADHGAGTMLSFHA